LSNNEPLLVSDFASAEFASAVARRVRMQELTPEQGRIALSGFDIWVARMADWIEIGATDVALATTYLRRLDLPLRAPDAIHIAIAQRVDAMLVTFDQRMAASALALGALVATP
jgi:predicted nucleic acid-binding protein